MISLRLSKAILRLFEPFVRKVLEDSLPFLIQMCSFHIDWIEIFMRRNLVASFSFLPLGKALLPTSRLNWHWPCSSQQKTQKFVLSHFFPCCFQVVVLSTWTVGSSLQKYIQSTKWTYYKYALYVKGNQLHSSTHFSWKQLKSEIHQNEFCSPHLHYWLTSSLPKLLSRKVVCRVPGW